MICRAVWQRIGGWASIGFAFFVPISTAGTTLCMVLVMLAWLLGGEYRKKIWSFGMQPFAKWVIFFILLSLLGGFFSVADWQEISLRLRDTMRFVCIPFFMFYLLGPKKLSQVAWAFSLAMVVTLLFAFLKVYAGFPIGAKYTMAAVFKSHIKTNFFMSVAAFHLALQAKAYPNFRKFLVPVVGVMIYYVLFMSAGRVGYVTLMGFAFVFFLHCFPTRRVLATSVATLFVVVFFGLAYQFSDNFADRVQALNQDWGLYKQGGQLHKSSLGARVTFNLYSLDLIKARPFFGWGTGSFKAAYEQLAQKRGDNFLTDNPHNEYLRVGVEWGGLGLWVLFGLFFCQWRLTRQLTGQDRTFFKGLLLMFFLGCLGNSWLIDFTEGSFYSIMSATLLAQSITQKRERMQSRSLPKMINCVV